MEGRLSMNEVTPPLSVTQLNDRLEQVAAESGIPVARARVMLCTLIVSQMLPDAVAVKGGMGVKLRLGERGTRATSSASLRARLTASPNTLDLALDATRLEAATPTGAT